MQAITLAMAATLERLDGDLPIAAHVAGAVAALARARDLPHQTAQLLGFATRLRGHDDPTDRELAELAAWARERLGDEEFTSVRNAATGAGQALDGIDPALVAAVPG